MKKIIPAFAVMFLTIAQFTHAQTYSIKTLAHTGDNPISAYSDSIGNVYVANLNGNTVQEYVKGVGIKTIAGDGNAASTGDGGPATAAELFEPGDVALDDSGNVYISEYLGNFIRKIDRNGIIHTFAGTGGQGYTGDGGLATAAQLNLPLGLAFDHEGNLYIADNLNSVIRKITKGDTISTYAGDGNANYSGDNGQATDAELNYPEQIAFDGYDNLYIADFLNNAIRKVDKNGVITTVANGISCDGIAADRFGRLYFSDDANNVVGRIDLKGNVATIAGTGAVGYSGDGGEALLAKFHDPDQESIDDSGHIYIADEDNNVIRELIPDCYTALTVSPSVPLVCTGQSAMLIAHGAKTYQWSPSKAINTIFGDTVLVDPTVTTTYYVTATDSPGCFSALKVVVTVEQAAKLAILPDSPSICNGTSIILTTTDPGIYTWSPAASLNPTTGNVVTATPTATTTYTVNGTDSAGCPAHATDVVTILAAPNKPTITISVTDDSLISSATQGNQWLLNDTTISGATDQVLVTNGRQGIYRVTVINPANGCSATSDSLTFTGVEQLSVNNYQLSVYPNPTTGSITVSSSKDIDEITVTNLLGQLIYTTQPKQTKFNFELRDEGMYFITVKIGDTSENRAVVVTR